MDAFDHIKEEFKEKPEGIVRFFLEWSQELFLVLEFSAIMSPGASCTKMSAVFVSGT